MSQNEHASPADPGGQHQRPGRRAAALLGAVTVIGVLVATASLLRDYFDWRSPAPVTTTEQGRPGTPGGGPATTGSAPRPGPATVGLATRPVEAGRVDALPRPLVGQSKYAGAIPIDCPSNQSTDRQRDVTYRTDRRYLTLTATVQPYFREAADAEALARVSVLAVIRNRDDTVARLERGAAAAEMSDPGALNVDISGADQIVLRIECESPLGSVLLLDAKLVHD